MAIPILRPSADQAQGCLYADSTAEQYFDQQTVEVMVAAVSEITNFINSRYPSN